MRERSPVGARRKGMRFSVLVLVLVAALAAGCGSAGDSKGAEPGSPTTTECAYIPEQVTTIRADVNGEGTADEVEYLPSFETCPASLVSTVGSEHLTVTVSDELLLAEHGLRKVTIPGRTGDLLLLMLSHPRGGFQARLYGYADGKLAELTSGDSPIFGFLATDAPTEHVAATCTRNGFEVTEAVAHQPIGVVPAWDIYRTTYEVDGNTVTAGDRTEVADNVLDEALHKDHAGLVANSLFANC